MNKENVFMPYQSKETEWRYHSYCSSLLEDIARLNTEIKLKEEQLAQLRNHPPLISLFNWSA